MQRWFKILRNAKPYSTTKSARRITSIQTHCTWCESVFVRVRVRVSVHSMLIQFSKKQRREGLNCLPQTRSWRERVHDWRWLCTARSSNRIQFARRRNRRRRSIGDPNRRNEERFGSDAKGASFCVVCVCEFCEFSEKQNNSTPPHLFSLLSTLQQFYNFNVSVTGISEMEN